MKLKMLAVAAVSVLAAGCGSEEPAEPVGHNDADIAFAQGMIPHHEQAVEMADLVEGRTTTPAVLDLAKRIKAAQEPEIALMTGWLTEWAAELPSDDHAGHGDMPGMMTSAEMDRLETAKGTEFDHTFAEMMIRHHEGAITMAERELADGANPDAKALASRIIADQRAEIGELTALLPQG